MTKDISIVLTTLLWNNYYKKTQKIDAQIVDVSYKRLGN
jgi:hypothetical protein